jgi:hypothetical protein
MSNLHHYRNVYKSDHLSIFDLEDMNEQGKSLVFTIKEVKQQMGVSVAGKKGDFNIAYFVEDIKPLVINATNGKVLRTLAPDKSAMVEHWVGITIELYIDPNVNLKGERVGGVRIKKPAGLPMKPKIQHMDKCIEAIKSGQATKISVFAKYDLTAEQINQINAL